MDWLIDWLIDYWNLQKQVWWEFTARKNAGISEKFCGKVLQKSFMGKFFGKVLQKVLQKSFKGKFFGKFYRKFYGEILRKKFYGGNGEPGLDWDLESCWSVTAPVRVTDLLASPDLPNFLTNKNIKELSYSHLFWQLLVTSNTLWWFWWWWDSRNMNMRRMIMW